jgi:quercetin dioxygenase-like cupin family protein
MSFILHTLPAKGREQVADRDELIAKTNEGALLLIHVPPGNYAYESHRMPEFIVCIDGELVMQSKAGNSTTARVGQMIEVPPGLEHRFAPTSNAVILTMAQKAP